MIDPKGIFNINEKLSAEVIGELQQELDHDHHKGVHECSYMKFSKKKDKKSDYVPTPESSMSSEDRPKLNLKAVGRE